MDLETFEVKAEMVERVREINNQLKLLNKIGEKLCNKDHCQVGFNIKLVDELEKQREEATNEADGMAGSVISFGWSTTDEEKYTDSVKIDLCDRSAIGLIGTLMRELEKERKTLLQELEAV